METKLTLRLDDSLIQQAKDYAKQHDKSLSLVVSDYFRALTSNEQQPAKATANAPITQSLVGILSADDVTQDDYKKHLEDKYL